MSICLLSNLLKPQKINVLPGNTTYITIHFFSNKDNLPFQIIISPPTQNLFDLFKGFFPTILIKQNLNVHNEYILYSRKLGNHLIRTIKKSMKDTNFVYDLIDVIDIFVQEKQNTVALEYTSMKELPNLNKD